MKEQVVLTGEGLTIEDVVVVARQRARVAPLTASARVLASLRWVERVAKGEIRGESGRPLGVYSVNTPFGSRAFESVFTAPAEAEELSRNLITSHAAGVGRYFAEDVVRAALLIRANTLAKGFSGIRWPLQWISCASPLPNWAILPNGVSFA